MSSLTSLASSAASSKAFVQASANKRPVNLSLSEGVVRQARNYTANLSATAEALLADYVAEQRRAKATRQQQANDWCADWNAVHEAQASFADEHSTL